MTTISRIVTSFAQKESTSVATSLSGYSINDNILTSGLPFSESISESVYESLSESFSSPFLNQSTTVNLTTKSASESNGYATKRHLLRKTGRRSNSLAGLFGSGLLFGAFYKRCKKEPAKN